MIVNILHYMTLVFSNTILNIILLAFKKIAITTNMNTLRYSYQNNSWSTSISIHTISLYYNQNTAMCVIHM